MRTRTLAAGAVLVVAAIPALAALSARRGAPATQAGSASVESTRALEAVATYTPPAFDTNSPSGALAVAGSRQRDATPIEPRAFDVDAAMVHVRALETLGVRAGGSAAEEQAVAYIFDRLTALGLDARIEEFGLPDGATSRNVIARVKGSSDAVLVLGAHMDSKPPSPGANDNGSGCGALLEIAAILVEDPVVPTVEIVFFGAEEIIGGQSDWHHFGSRYRVSQMTAAERAQTAGMLSVDMIGYGPDFHSRAMGIGPEMLSDILLAHAKTMGIGMTFKKDTSSSGLSDHEPYEKAGIPAACVCWREDPVYHTADDVSAHLNTARIATTGKLVLDFARSLDAADLATLTAR